MRPARWLLLTQLAICVAILASAALYVHYLDPVASDFCALDSGCESVRQSELSLLAEQLLPLPLLGLVSYLALLLFSCRLGSATQSAGSRRGFAQRRELQLFALAGVGAALGAALLAYQALSVGRYCWMCVVVDVSAMATGCFSFFLAKAQREAPTLRVHSPLSGYAWLTLAGLLVIGPFAWQATAPVGSAPEGVRTLYVEGKINVIEFADFQCPFCRRFHRTLQPLLKEYGDRVNFKRLHRPLPRHPMAEAAARAAICAAEQGRGEEMADQLFEIKLSPATLSKAANSLQLDTAAFDACSASASTTATLAEHKALLPDSELEGLPTTYVGPELIVGGRTDAALRDAFDRAAQPAPAPSARPMLIGLFAAIAAFCAYFGRRSQDAT
jgi:predicted DsbA family dithiol-disulfide isomerase/uncharacterized membrane protein